MHQVEVSTPQGKGEQVAKMALDAGISQASVSQVYAHGPNKNQDVVKVQTDTPSATRFIENVMGADFFNPQNYNIASQTLPGIVSSSKPSKLTVPMRMAAFEVFEDLWARSQITVSYIARASVSALLLAYGMMQNDLITMIAALLFTPFLAQDLSVGFGLIARQTRLAVQGAIALGVSTVITFVAGVIVAALMGGPLQFDQFSSLLTNLLISLIVGIAAGLATGDMVGRRELIGMAAAAQFAIYPAWFGIQLVLGFPDAEVAGERLLTFIVNVVTILIASVVVYAAMRYLPSKLEPYTKAVQEE